MNKQEIEERIKIHENAIIASESVIAELKSQLAEAEKPKLRHGDFGISKEGGARVVLEHKCNLITAGDGSTYPHEYEGYNPDPILGNIFDLLKEWSEPFEDYEKKSTFADGQYDVDFKVNITDSGCINLFMSSLGDLYGTFTVEDIKEISNALGHAIAELKRKKNKCS